jgi:hypothetical protein
MPVQSPINTVNQPSRSRNTSHASSLSSSDRLTPSGNDRPRSRNDPTLSQVSVRGKLPEAADPEYSYVYVPSLSSLPTSSNTIVNKVGDIDRMSMQRNHSGRSSRSSYLDAGPYNPGRPRSANNMRDHPHLNRYSSQDRIGRHYERSRSDEWAEKGAAVVTREVPDRNGGTTTRVIKRGVKDF